MHTLRHEEFQRGCKAACNGPWAGRWSKTMMGFADEVWGACLGAQAHGVAHFHTATPRTSINVGVAACRALVPAPCRPPASPPRDRRPAACALPTCLQDSSFVLELTYNYDVKQYRLGNDHGFFKIRNRVAFKSLEDAVRGWRGRVCGGEAPLPGVWLGRGAPQQPWRRLDRSWTRPARPQPLPFAAAALLLRAACWLRASQLHAHAPACAARLPCRRAWGRRLSLMCARCAHPTATSSGAQPLARWSTGRGRRSLCACRAVPLSGCACVGTLTAPLTALLTAPLTALLLLPLGGDRVLNEDPTDVGCFASVCLAVRLLRRAASCPGGWQAGAGRQAQGFAALPCRRPCSRSPPPLPSAAPPWLLPSLSPPRLAPLLPLCFSRPCICRSQTLTAAWRTGQMCWDSWRLTGATTLRCSVRVGAVPLCLCCCLFS